MLLTHACSLFLILSLHLFSLMGCNADCVAQHLQAVPHPALHLCLLSLVPLSLLSHYRSLVSWPGLVLTVLVSIGSSLSGAGLPVSDLTELRFVHISL